MANGIDIGKAYVQVIPSTEGISSSISDALSDSVSAAEKSTSGKVASIASGVAKVGAAAIAATTAGVVAFGKSSVQAGMSFDQAMSQVAATMGKDVAQIQTLRDFAQEMGSTTQFSATQAAEALNYMALAGYKENEMLQMLPSVLNLAAAGAMDLATASDMVTDAQSALGLEFSEVSNFVDQLAKTSSTTNTSVAQLGEAILTVGGTATNMSGGITEINTALGVLANYGIKSAEGGTHLRNAILSLASPTTNAAGVMNDLGLSVFDVNGEMRDFNEIFSDLNNSMASMTQAEKIWTLSTLFNKTDLSAINALLSATCGYTKDLNTSLYDSGVNFEEVAENWGALTGQSATSQEVFNAIKDSVVQLSDSGAEAEDIIAALQDSFGMTATDAELATTAILGAVDAQKEYNNTLSGTGVDWSKYYNTAWYQNGGMDGLIEEMVYNITQVGGSAEEIAEYFHFEYDLDYEDALAAVNAMTQAVYGQESEWNSAREAIEDCNGAAQKMAETQLDNLAGDITIFQSALEGAQIAVSDKLTPTLREFVQFGSDGLSRMTQAFKEEGLGGAMKEFGSILADGIAMLSEQMPKIVDAGGQLLVALVKGLVDNLPQLTQAALDIISTLARGLADALPELIPQIARIIPQIVSTLIANIDLIISAGFDLIVGLVTGLIRAIPEIIAAIPQLIQALITAFIGNLPQILGLGLEIIVALVTGLIGAIPQLIAAIPQIVLAILNGFKEGVIKFIDIGVDIIKGIGQGFMDGIHWIGEKIKEIVDAIVQAFKDLFGIHSPSTVMAELGGFLIEGLLSGISAAWNAIVEFFSAAWDAIVQGASVVIDGLSSAFNAAKEAVQNAWEGIKEFFSGVWQGIQDIFQAVGEWFSEKFTAAKEGIVHAFEAVKDFFGDVWQGIVDIFGTVKEWFSEKFEAAKEAIQTAFNTVGEFFSGVWDNIKSIYENVKDWFSERFTAAKEAVISAWDNVKSKFTDVWNGIQEAFGNVKEWFSEKFEAAKEAVVNIWNNIKEFFSETWENIQNVFADVANWFKEKFEGAREAVEGAWTAVTDFFKGVWDGITEIFKDVADWFKKKFEDAKEAVINAWDAVTTAFENILKGIKDVFEGIADWFREKFEAAREAALKAWDTAVEMFGNIWQNIQNVFSNVAEWFEGVFTSARDKVANAWNAIEEKFVAVRTKIENVFNKFESWAETTSKGAFNKFTSAWNNIKSKFSDIWKKIKDAFSLKDAVQWGKDMISNFADGIKNAVSGSKFVQSLTGAANKVKGMLGFSEPEEGPLSDFHTYAPDMMKLFAEGVYANEKLIQDALSTVLTIGTPSIDSVTLDNQRLSDFRSTQGYASNTKSDSTTTYNFYSPKALDPVSAMREARKASQRMAMAC